MSEMRVLVLAVVAALGLLAVVPAAEARPQRRTTAQVKKRVAISTKPARRIEEPRGQSFGAPWSGRLRDATKLRESKRYHLRRPHRAFGTRTTVEHTRRAIVDTLASFPKVHVLAIGDISAPRGGHISEHSSHQSGRDVDIGLFFKTKPARYPATFVDATASTLHIAATWALISNLASTHGRDGGVHVMFLDFDLQGVIFRWAKANGVSVERLERLFQYPHGRGASAGLIRHEPNHANHLHVRFKCAAADRGCR